MICKMCGAQIAENAKFCDSCGVQTEAEQASIQSQTMQTRQQNPAPQIKTAVFLTIMFWVLFPGVGWLLSEGDLFFVGIMCATAGAFTVFTWIVSLVQYRKYLKGTNSQNINRRQ